MPDYRASETCRNGHPWPESAYVKKNGQRFCRVCAYDKKKAAWRKKLKMPKRILPLPERFWAYVDKSAGHGPKGDCWIWTGGKLPGGYGLFHEGRKNIRAHRYSWELANGPIPDDLIVCHKCDNPPCVNLDHLFLGTDADNVKDKMDKGRGPDMKEVSKYRRNPAGERNGRAVHRWETIEEIRQLHASGRSCNNIAQEFGFSSGYISRIVRRIIWKESGHA